MRVPARVFLFCLALPAFAQQVAAPPGLQVPRATDRRIALDVTVTDKSGKPATGLQQTDFTLIDNKQPDKILSFQAMDGATADPPVEIILLMDRVNTGVQGAANVRIQVKKFLDRNGGQLARPTSLIFFSDSGTSIQSPTRDGKALIAQVDQSESGLRTLTRSQGVYGAIDRFQLSIKALDSIAGLEARKPGRKLLIWLSPGWPMLSGPGIQLTSKNQQDLFNAIVAVSTALSQAQVTLYSIDTLGVSDAGGPRTFFYQEFLKGVTSPKQVEAGDLALQVIAAQSGGRVLNSGNDIGSLIASCIDDTNAWYVLTFDSPPADGPNEYHKLDVKVARPGFTARTRTGYYAQP